MQIIESAIAHITKTPTLKGSAIAFCKTLIIFLAVFSCTYIIQYMVAPGQEIYAAMVMNIISIVCGFLAIVCVTTCFPFLLSIIAESAKVYRSEIARDKQGNQLLLASGERITIPWPDTIVYNFPNETTDELKRRFWHALDMASQGSLVLFIPMGHDEVVVAHGITQDTTTQTRAGGGFLGDVQYNEGYLIAYETYPDFLAFVRMAKDSFLKDRGKLSVITQERSQVCTWLKRTLIILFMLSAGTLSAGVIKSVSDGLSAELKNYVPKSGEPVVFKFADIDIERTGDNTKTVAQLITASNYFNDNITTGQFLGVQLQGRLLGSVEKPKTLFNEQTPGAGVTVDSATIAKNVDVFINEGDALLLEFRKVLLPVSYGLYWVFSKLGIAGFFYICFCVYVATVTRRNGNLGPIMLRLQRKASAHTALGVMASFICIGIMLVLYMINHNWSTPAMMIAFVIFIGIAVLTSNLIIPNGKEVPFEELSSYEGSPFKKQLPRG
jgi:hypothetical protein